LLERLPANAVISTVPPTQVDSGGSAGETVLDKVMKKKYQKKE
jgi:hypothetical protein